MLVEYDGDRLKIDKEYVRLVTSIEDSIREELDNVDWEILDERLGDNERIVLLTKLQDLYLTAKTFNMISNLPTEG